MGRAVAGWSCAAWFWQPVVVSCTWQCTITVPGALEMGERVTQLLKCRDCSCLAVQGSADVFSTGTVLNLQSLWLNDDHRRLPNLYLPSPSGYAPAAAVIQGWYLPAAPAPGKRWQLRHWINSLGLSVPLARDFNVTAEAVTGQHALNPCLSKHAGGSCLCLGMWIWAIWQLQMIRLLVDLTAEACVPAMLWTTLSAHPS